MEEKRKGRRHKLRRERVEGRRYGGEEEREEKKEGKEGDMK